MNPRIIAIVAMTEQNGIGVEGKIPWHIPEDMMRFKTFTQYQPVIMGRVTYDSLPPRVRPLPERDNIIVSENAANLTMPQGAYPIPTPEGALQKAKELLQRGATNEIFVIGGGTIYHALWKHLDAIYLTTVEGFYPCDRFFPEIARDEWVTRFRQHYPEHFKTISSLETVPAHTFSILERRRHSVMPAIP